MSDFIALDIQGVAAVQKMLESILPEAIMDEVSNDVSQFLAGPDGVLRTYPPEKRVTRAQAYPDAPAGPGWFSDRQRRWFFAALNSGELALPYLRTQALRQAWEIIGGGMNTIIANELDYAGYVMGNTEQSRMSGLIGWRTMDKVLMEHESRINRIVEGAVRRYLDKVAK